MIIDSHCHLNMKDFNNGLDQVIKNAKEKNVKGMLTICTEVAEINEIKHISNSYENIWYSLGVHPNNVNNNLFKTISFGWSVLKYVKSNAILVAKDCTTLAIGAGQVSRVDSVDIAINS